jgi:outer membrane lipoprotein carrier protein
MKKTLSLFLFTLASLAEAGAVEDLRSFTRDLRTYSGDFQQQLVNDSGKVTKTLSGGFALAKGGKFRWSIEKPYTQLMVSDGQRALNYDADLKQVTSRKLDSALQSTPLALLNGTSEFEANFTLAALPDSKGLAWVSATAKKTDSPVSDLQLGFEAGNLKALSWVDHFGQKSLVTFSQTSKNSTIAESMFRFSAPIGTEIIHSD